MEELKKLIQEAAEAAGGKLPCPVAFKIARDNNYTLTEIGDACNELKIKVSACQLGCFK